MRRFALLAVFSMLVCTLGLAELVDNPSYQNWAKYKVGTTVVHNQEMQMAGGFAMKMQMEAKQTLTELTAEKAVVEMNISNPMAPGRSQTMKMTYPAQIENSNSASQGFTPEDMQNVQFKMLAPETIKVGDKEYACKVGEFSGEQKGMKVSGKSWVNADVPGQLVKSEMKATGSAGGANADMPAMDMTIIRTLKSFEAK